MCQGYESHKTIGFLAILVWISCKNHKVTKPALNVGSPLVRQSLPSSTKKKNNNKKRCQSRTPSGKTFWICAKCANSFEPSLRSDL